MCFNFLSYCISSSELRSPFFSSSSFFVLSSFPLFFPFQFLQCSCCKFLTCLSLSSLVITTIGFLSPSPLWFVFEWRVSHLWEVGSRCRDTKDAIVSLSHWWASDSFDESVDGWSMTRKWPRCVEWEKKRYLREYGEFLVRVHFTITYKYWWSEVFLNFLLN